MAADMPVWPDFSVLSQHGEQASLSDDLRRSSLSVSVVVPHWTERFISAYDCQTGQVSGNRFFCPLAGGGKSPHTLLALYNLQGALLLDTQLPLSGKQNFSIDARNNRCQLDAGVMRLADSGHGGLLVRRISRDCLALSITDDERPKEGESSSSVTVFFNRLRSPHTYKALVSLGRGIRSDNRYFPFSGYRRAASLSL